MPRDDLAGVADHHRIHVPFHLDLAMAIAGRHGVVVAAVTHQADRAHPARPLIAGIKGNRGKRTAGHQVLGQPLVNGLAVAAQNLAPALQTRQTAVQVLKTGNVRHRYHEVAPGIADQTLDLSFVVALAGAAEPILKQVMRLQLGEGSCPLAPPKIAATASAVLS